MFSLWTDEPSYGDCENALDFVRIRKNPIRGKNVSVDGSGREKTFVSSL
jgi:hypothetical protein